MSPTAYLARRALLIPVCGALALGLTACGPSASETAAAAKASAAQAAEAKAAAEKAEADKAAAEKAETERVAAEKLAAETDKAAAKAAAAKAAAAKLAATRVAAAKAAADAARKAASITTRKKAKAFFEDIAAGDIDWSEAPVKSPQGQDRLIGIVAGSGAIVELIGPKDALTEIQLMVVMNGTSQVINFDRVLPLIKGAQKYGGGDPAGRFVVDELVAISERDAVPAITKNRKFGKRNVRFIGWDVINTVNVTITVVK